MPVSEAIAARILDAVDAEFDSQVDFLRDLVAQPSVMGHEAAAQSMMAAAMGERGLEVDQWTLDASALADMAGAGRPLVDYANSPNVVGVHRGSDPSARSLILNGHIDVVPTGPEASWTSPPFEPRIEGGWLYGRGAADMKAGLVACLFAWDALRRVGVAPAGDVIVQSVVEEESTGNGALACVQRGYRADAALIPEPTFGTYVWTHVGLQWLDVHVSGKPAHASRPERGANAIELAYELFADLKGLEDEWNARKSEFPAFADQERPINLMLSRIEGGDWHSSVPSWCTLSMRVGLYPGVPVEEVRAAVERQVATFAAGHPFLADHAPRVEWVGHSGAGYELSGGDAVIELLEATHQQAFGQPLIPIASGGSSDARVFGLAGIPTLLYGPVSRYTHAFDEAVQLDSVRRITASLALFTAGWCGLTDA